MLDLLFKRRSIRKYKKAMVEEDKIKKIIDCALLSPSSRSIRPWEFIVVEDSNMITELSKSKKHGSTFLDNAPLAIVVISDTTKSDVWVEDSSIASIIIQLEAEKLGLGSCWIQIRNRYHNNSITSNDYVKNLLNIPDNYEVESIIALGYPDEEKEPYNPEDLLYEKIHYEKFNK